MPLTFILTGQSGRTYSYTAHDPAVVWNAVEGNYVFAIITPSGISRVAHPLYIGTTDSLQRRMNEHRDNVWADVHRHGANGVLARVIVNERERLAEEEDLIRNYNPVPNSTHTRSPSPIPGLGALRNRLLDP